MAHVWFGVTSIVCFSWCVGGAILGWVTSSGSLVGWECAWCYVVLSHDATIALAEELNLALT
jgi:hypothetical protein